MEKSGHLRNAAIVLALKDGLGVEDIGVRGIATAAEARALVDRLRRTGWLKAVYARAKRGRR